MVKQSTVEGEEEEVSIEVTQTITTTADDCTLMMTNTEGDLATPDSEEFSFGGVSAAEPEICALCPSPNLSARFENKTHQKNKTNNTIFQDCRTWTLRKLLVFIEKSARGREEGAGGGKK